MKTVLLVWEFGGGRGHISRLLRCAALVSENGGIPIFVVPPSHLKDEELNAVAKVMSAPIADNALLLSSRMGYVNSFADILHNFGFTNTTVLESNLRQWIVIFNNIKPDSIITDYAPNADLASLLLGIPTTHLSAGFESPPPECPIFTVNKVTEQKRIANAVTINKISDTINRVSLKVLGKSGPTLQVLLSYHPVFMTSILETDPYMRTKNAVYLGPISNNKRLAQVVWPGEGRGSAGKAFLYMRSIQKATAWIDALMNADISTHCYIPSTEIVPDKYTNSVISISNTPLNITDLLRTANICINCGQGATVCHTALAGVPQLMLPFDTEKEMVAGKLASHNAGVVGRDVPGTHQDQISLLLSSSDIKTAALGIAAKYAQNKEDVSAELLLRAIGLT